MSTIYFDVPHAVQEHDRIIEISGGTPGMLDQGRLESVLSHVQNDDYYPEFLDKITHLCFSINKNHAFNDGNKRTSIALSAFFLIVNGYDYCVSNFIREMENIAVWVADNLVDKALLKNIIFDILMEESRESTKVELIQAASQHATLSKEDLD